jgi:DNA modification methylase
MKQQVKISKVKGNPSNPRIIKNDKFKKLVKSIKEFPEMLKLRPIVVDEDFMVLGGNMRLKASKEAGLSEVWIEVAEGLTEEQKKEFIVKDNVGFGEWEWDMLANEWDSVQLAEWGLDVWENEDDKVTEGLIDDDEIPEVKESIVKRGDIWQLGEHRIMCGDSTSSDDVEKLMNGEKADMVFTDPPYGINMSRSLVSGKDNSIKNDNIKGLDVLLNKSLKNAFNFSKENINCYCWIGFRAYNLAESIFNKYWKTSNCIIWNKPSIGLGGKGYRYKHELCLFSGNIKDKSLSDVWEFNRDRSGLHPTMKPVELVVKAINDSIKIKNIVLDLFLGSGSTLIAAEKLNRKCYGMELDEKYCDVIINRWEQFTGLKAIKNGTK